MSIAEMIITVEAKSKPCPGVERAISLAEDLLARDESLYSVGQLIHNQREVIRLQEMGLHVVDPSFFLKATHKELLTDAHFLVRAHGEGKAVLDSVMDKGIHIVDATCPIVRHSQELIDQHVKEGWGIIIAGKTTHPEVKALMDRTDGKGIIISTLEDAKKKEMDDRSLFIAQTTINPKFFSKIRKILSTRLSGFKTVDTTCRFLRNRQADLEAFGQTQDIVLLIGGNNSSNCQLLFDTILKVNERSYKLEGPEELNPKWFKNGELVGISGAASTPRWQLEEIKKVLSNHKYAKNPKGLKNRKGGNSKWWTWKNQNKTK